MPQKKVETKAAQKKTATKKPTTAKKTGAVGTKKTTHNSKQEKQATLSFRQKNLYFQGVTSIKNVKSLTVNYLIIA